MTLQEIKQAIADGKTVHWANGAYNMRHLKILAIAVFILACSKLSSSHLDDLKADEITSPYMTFDAVKDGYFTHSALADSVCGIDQRGTDTWCEIATNGIQQNSIILKDNQ